MSHLEPALEDGGGGEAEHEPEQKEEEHEQAGTFGLLLALDHTLKQAS